MLITSLIWENMKKVMVCNDIKRIAMGICTAILSVSVLAGCGKKTSSELDAYKESMTEFYDKLTYYNGAINGIDPESESAKDQLLLFLDDMNDSYRKMADTEIPEEFSGISDIAVEAADYMQMANECYHMAYDGAFDEDEEMLAAQYYQRANSRAMVMLQVLHGKVPEGEGVTVETQEPGDFDAIGGSEDEQAEDAQETQEESSEAIGEN